MSEGMITANKKFKLPAVVKTGNEQEDDKNTGLMNILHGIVDKCLDNPNKYITAINEMPREFTPSDEDDDDAQEDDLDAGAGV